MGEQKFVQTVLPFIMINMAATTICGKSPLQLCFSGANREMTLKLGIQHRGLRPYKVYLNDDHGVSLTYFKTRSNLLPDAFYGKMLIETLRVYRNY